MCPQNLAGKTDAWDARPEPSVCNGGEIDNTSERSEFRVESLFNMHLSSPAIKEINLLEQTDFKTGFGPESLYL